MSSAVTARSARWNREDGSVHGDIAAINWRSDPAQPPDSLAFVPEIPLSGINPNDRLVIGQFVLVSNQVGVASAPEVSFLTITLHVNNRPYDLPVGVQLRNEDGNLSVSLGLLVPFTTTAGLLEIRILGLATSPAATSYQSTLTAVNGTTISGFLFAEIIATPTAGPVPSPATNILNPAHCGTPEVGPVLPQLPPAPVLDCLIPDAPELPGVVEPELPFAPPGIDGIDGGIGPIGPIGPMGPPGAGAGIGMNPPPSPTTTGPGECVPTGGGCCYYTCGCDHKWHGNGSNIVDNQCCGGELLWFAAQQGATFAIPDCWHVVGEADLTDPIVTTFTILEGCSEAGLNALRDELDLVTMGQADGEGAFPDDEPGFTRESDSPSCDCEKGGNGGTHRCPKPTKPCDANNVGETIILCDCEEGIGPESGNGCPTTTAAPPDCGGCTPHFALVLNEDDVEPVETLPDCWELIGKLECNMNGYLWLYGGCTSTIPTVTDPLGLLVDSGAGQATADDYADTNCTVLIDEPFPDCDCPPPPPCQDCDPHWAVFSSLNDIPPIEDANIPECWQYVARAECTSGSPNLYQYAGCGADGIAALTAALTPSQVTDFDAKFHSSGSGFTPLSTMITDPPCGMIFHDPPPDCGCPPPPPVSGKCCVDGNCVGDSIGSTIQGIMTAASCDTLDGVWIPDSACFDLISCPSPPPPSIGKCCLDGDCIGDSTGFTPPGLMNETQCIASGGQWIPSVVCSDPQSCPPTSTDCATGCNHNWVIVQTTDGADPVEINAMPPCWQLAEYATCDGTHYWMYAGCNSVGLSAISSAIVGPAFVLSSGIGQQLSLSVILPTLGIPSLGSCLYNLANGTPDCGC